MKNFTKLFLVIFAIMQINHAFSQPIYADTVLNVSSSYSSCPNYWSECKILGAPDVYPNCGDVGGAWAFSIANNSATVHPREWIEVGFNTHYYVDSINVYQTNHSGIIDTIYFRDAQTGLWNLIYSNAAAYNSSCEVLRLGMIATIYKVDAVRLAISGEYTGVFPEYDAVELIGSTVSSVGIDEMTISNVNVFPNPSSGEITVNTKGFSSMKIYDVVGKVVFSKEKLQHIEQISVNLLSGIYFLSIKKNNNDEIVKIIVY